MKALTRALWAPALLGLFACSSAGGGNAAGEPEHSATEPIIGGHLDTTTKGVVALAFAAHSQVAVFCSGSLLAPNLVLTARHCIARIDDGSSEEVHCDSSEFTAQYDPKQIFVSTDSTPEGTSQLYGVKEIREAPGGSKVCGFDIALLILSGSGIAGSVATPIEPVLNNPTLAKATFSAVGYGLRDPKDTAGTTAGTRERYDSSSVYCVGASCPASAGTEDDEFIGNSPVCSGDSGGPALDSAGRVFGVTSRGDSECTYALYSNVASWAAFVRSTALDAAAQGGYTPPAWATPGGGAGSGGASSAGSGGGVSNGGASSGGTSSGGTSSGGASSGGTSSGGASSTSAGAPASYAGARSSGTAGDGSTTPITPTGAACMTSADCRGGYLCYSASLEPPGTCVPPCSAANTTCPTDYSCSTKDHACLPTVTTKHASTSCALRAAPQGGGNAAFAVVLGLGGAWLGRRRRNAG